MINTFLVLGGCGFIGSNMVDFLIEKKHEVIVIDNLLTGKIENLNTKAKFYNLDISDKKSVPLIEKIIKSVNYIIHMAALPNVQESIDNPTKAHINNFDTTLNILNIIKKYPDKKLIFSSTSAVYGNPKFFPIDELHPINPISPYALQKLMCEEYIKMYSNLYNIDCIVLRYFNVFGERMTNFGAYKSVISVFKEQKEKNTPLTITNDGNQTRDFIYVRDVVMSNYLACLAQIKKFEIFNVGSNKNISVNEIASFFNQEVEFIGNRNEPRTTLCDSTKIKKALGWQPTISVRDWISNHLLS